MRSNDLHSVSSTSPPQLAGALTEQGSQRKQDPKPVRPVLLSIQDVAQMLGISVRGVSRHVDAGRMPRPIKLGGSVRWRVVDLEEWVAGGCPRVRGGKAGL